MPYSVGLQAVGAAFISAGFATQFTTSVIIFLLIVFNTVIIVSGESARQEFFTAKNFDLTEGFKILSGAIPMVRGVTSDLQTRRVALIHKRLADIQRNEPLSQLIPLLLEDSRRIMEGWGDSGVFDPFKQIYELTFQTTVRSLSCSEISDDAILVSRLKNLYDKLDTGTTPATVLIPWAPTPSMVRKLWATKEIYDIIVAAIKAREESGVQRDDALQMLLDFKDEKLVVVGFIMGLLIAGARATGTAGKLIFQLEFLKKCSNITCWLLTYLGGHQEWRAKAYDEIQSLLAAHPAPEDCASISKQLATIPLETWESSTPVLDSIIRETLRVAQPHTAMRRNLGPDTYINGKLIRSGAYVVYPFSDIHLDPGLYPDPWKFDPAREETKVPYGYVGWGGGKTTCLGTRLAKLELKLITAMLLLGFNHDIVDDRGVVADPLPTPNWNDILLCRPPKGTCNLRYSRTATPL
ncbi:cytochrome P450 [Desarmillaria tabescens]|uniref:Cytochrome P450 n=1 Tax=Armillaria tabescens TaxID=1929756 RepID=A0AA39J2V7_ARMTA|nr:cytochrome P450 [Desarmillaria tabescens]KAK0434277.1 cytochrome P450 [Desarmillaria tabescens]